MGGSKMTSIICKYCGTENDSEEIYCSNCKKIINIEKLKEQRLKSLEATRQEGIKISQQKAKEQAEIHALQEKKELERLRQYQEQVMSDLKNTARCPRCKSTSLSANKKGYGIGKAVVATAITGNALGLIAGNIGRNKVKVTCLNCGHKFDL